MSATRRARLRAGAPGRLPGPVGAAMTTARDAKPIGLHAARGPDRDRDRRAARADRLSRARRAVRKRVAAVGGSDAMAHARSSFRASRSRLARGGAARRAQRLRRASRHGWRPSMRRATARSRFRAPVPSSRSIPEAPDKGSAIGCAMASSKCCTGRNYDRPRDGEPTAYALLSRRHAISVVVSDVRPARWLDSWPLGGDADAAARRPGRADAGVRRGDRAMAGAALNSTAPGGAARRRGHRPRDAARSAGGDDRGDGVRGSSSAGSTSTRIAATRCRRRRSRWPACNGRARSSTTTPAAASCTWASRGQ